MPHLNGSDLDRLGWYRFLISAIVPRPIAWITTRSPQGVVNLAPFSFFNGVTAAPPTISVCISHREPEKDTLVNLRTNGEAVVHLIASGQESAANASSANYPPDQSEAQALGLALINFPPLTVPRLAATQLALACRLDRMIPVGEPATHLVLLTVVAAYVDPTISDSRGFPDPALHRPAARLGGDLWLDGTTWHSNTYPRPGRK